MSCQSYSFMKCPGCHAYFKKMIGNLETCCREHLGINEEGKKLLNSCTATGDDHTSNSGHNEFLEYFGKLSITKNFVTFLLTEVFSPLRINPAPNSNRQSLWYCSDLFFHLNLLIMPLSLVVFIPFCIQLIFECTSTNLFVPDESRNRAELAKITGSAVPLILCKPASRVKKFMENAAVDGYKASSLRGIHGVHSATEMAIEIFEVNASLQICR